MKPNDRFETVRDAQSIGSQLAADHQIQKRLIRSFHLRGGGIWQAADRFTQHSSDVGIGLFHQPRNKSCGRFIE